MTDEKELKDQRIPIMMTPSEVEAIDDWAFKNRIRSRGEAIRRLCQVGLYAYGDLQSTRGSLLSIADKLLEGSRPGLAIPNGANFGDPSIESAFVSLMESNLEAAEDAVALGKPLSPLLAFAAAMKDEKYFDVDLDKYTSVVKDTLEKVRAKFLAAENGKQTDSGDGENE